MLGQRGQLRYDGMKVGFMIGHISVIFDRGECVVHTLLIILVILLIMLILLLSLIVFLALTVFFAIQPILNVLGRVSGGIELVKAIYGVYVRIRRSKSKRQIFKND